MSKRQLIMILGAWTAIYIFLGFPSAWDEVFSVITGILIIILAYTMGHNQPTKPTGTVPYVEYKSRNINGDITHP